MVFSRILLSTGRLFQKYYRKSCLHNEPRRHISSIFKLSKAIIEIAKPLGIAVHDHIIVGKSGHASLRGMRLI
ncbi:hypothetical protein IC761_03700 [Bradyrhizobium commune]|uniref:RadC-like JAB domain-containing protein n=1 Tax=Bradyrhizobium commune TaxID=83627 RepID=A0A7S9H160_9BRAD|nr:hypothetical protein IC761_03700 [Bradyrhizobium commune]